MIVDLSREDIINLLRGTKSDCDISSKDVRSDEELFELYVMYRDF